MSDLTAALETALSADVPLVFGAVQIDLPSATIRLLDGAGELTFNGGTFVGRDSTFGVLAGVDSIDDGMGDEAPRLSITLHPSTDTAAATLSAPNMQGSRVRLWIGCVTRSTGAVVNDPYLVFDGELDQPTLSVGKGARTLEYECVSSMERLFEVREGHRLSDANHKRVWPGEEGLEHMSGLVKKIYWGVNGPRGAAAGNGSTATLLGMSVAEAAGRAVNR